MVSMAFSHTAHRTSSHPGLPHEPRERLGDLELALRTALEAEREGTCGGTRIGDVEQCIHGL